MLDTTTARGRSRGRGVAIASVERAFSSMNIIKIELRNKTGDKWLNHRMVCYIERDIFTSIEDAKILDYFQGMRTRRVNLPRTSGAGARSTDVDVDMIHFRGATS
ncbi:uncharacterized protein [Zea mays]|uniref:uncharacterized protein n=1 Tax=Zea mays TaxID=4577 RepID=UPI0009A9ABE7|nr:uncharacterized protein LOC109940820 [Zea mays]|eukprot:XP_020396716.1 uncharacterized protein LOC109940820 [Zea mays]